MICILSNTPLEIFGYFAFFEVKKILPLWPHALLKLSWQTKDQRLRTFSRKTMPNVQDQIDDATLNFTLGENETALVQLTTITQAHPGSFEAWHALTEVYFAQKDYAAALSAAFLSLVRIATGRTRSTVGDERLWCGRTDCL